MDIAFGRRSVVGEIGADHAAGAGADFAPAAEKYEVVSPLGKGGMGEVLLVRDRDLLRDVALKLLRVDVASPDTKRRFVAEAQATSQLEHPGIPPVYDIGVGADGRCYYSMKLVRGRSLHSVVEALTAGDVEIAREYDLHHLVTVLSRVAEAVHFAHEKGVIHRDLKPENVMLGAYGEVLVVDWGIAKVEGAAESETAVQTAETLADRMTHAGTVKGTIPFMSPEQASGRRLDRRSDVYALGAILYELLALRPAFEGGEVFAMLLRVARGEFEDVAARNPARPVNEFLAALCRRAMSKDPADRPQTAQAFADELRSFLDGRADTERRHRTAEALAAQGRAAMAHYIKAKDAIDGAEREAEETAARFKPWQSLEEKAPLLDAQEAVVAVRDAAVLAFGETTKLLEGALLAEPENATARSLLADLWRGRLDEAEQRRDRGDTSHALTMLRRYDDGRLATYVAGDGSLELTSEPSGAAVTIARFEDRRGVLYLGETRALGNTPFAPTALPMGSYLCILKCRGCRDVRYPVHITRNRAWTGHVKMRMDCEIDDGFVLVPGGPFIYGDGKSMKTMELPDFAIAETPVLFADWAEYLTAIEESKGLEAAMKLCPGTEGDGPLMERREDGTWVPRPNNVEGRARERCVREHGSEFERLLPLTGVSWHEAVAYCEWKTTVTGRQWRLPTEEEREKAARGVDGRRFPWGDLADPSLGKCLASRDERAQPEPPGCFPAATSVYGVIDAAGNQWDWTDSWWDARRMYRVIRGGGWDNGVGYLSCAVRNGVAPENRYTLFGIRPARSLAP